MSDIPALLLLDQKIKDFHKLQEPPTDLSAADAYTANLKKVSHDAQDEVQKVNKYIHLVEEKLNELIREQEALIKKNQEAIKKIFASLKSRDESISYSGGLRPRVGYTGVRMESPRRFLPEIHTVRNDNSAKNIVTSPTPGNLEKLNLAAALQQASKNLLNDRLNELINETKAACAKVKDGAELSEKDIAKLNGCFDSWINAKNESHEKENRRKKEEADKLVREQELQTQKEEENKRQEEANRKKKQEEKARQREEQRRYREEERQIKEEQLRQQREQEEADKREEEERKRREKEERRKQLEEEKRKKKEEAEKKKREEEEQKQREKEEAERRLEEEKRKKEEEERKKQLEEEERIKREEEVRRQREEEERQRREEEAARKREEERQRLEAEKKERERLQKEAEERAFRQDHNNWKSFSYDRDSGDQVDGRNAYHGGVCCVMTSCPGGIVEDDVQCTASDELDSVIDILEDDERPISSVTEIKSTKDSLSSEFPSRFYIPHYPALSQEDEVVVKISVNGSDWETILPVSVTPTVADYEKSVERLSGIEINDFTSVKAIVVSRPRGQSIVADKPGVSVYSSMDKNLKMFVPRDAYQTKTELRLTVKQVTSESLASFVRDSPALEPILSVNVYVTLCCQKTPSKSIEIDVLKGNDYKGDTRRGKSVQLYSSGDGPWRFADVEYKSNHNALSVSLPTGRHRHVVLDIEVPSSFPKDNVLKLVDDLYTCVNKSRVRMIVKQQAGDHQKCAVRIVKDDQWQDTTQSLAENGYTEGPDLRRPFNIQEGQRVQITATGNLEATEEIGEQTYLSYLGGVNVSLTLKVKDTWKQRDLPAYVGNINCCVIDEQGSVTRIAEVTLSLPKLQRERNVIAFAPVRFPYYLTSLARFVSQNVCKKEDGVWEVFLKTLLGEREFHSRYRNAKRKLTDEEPEKLCMTVLLDWMKAMAAHEDKIQPVKRALELNRLQHIADFCEVFVNYHKEQLTDDVMKEIAAGTSKDVRSLGQDLELDNSEVDKCINEHPHNTADQKLALLVAWRESAHVVKYGVKAKEHLKNVTV